MGDSTYDVPHEDCRTDEPWPVSPEHGIICDEVAQQAVEQEQASDYAQDVHHSHASILRLDFRGGSRRVARERRLFSDPVVRSFPQIRWRRHLDRA
jgi:hypothetical protein